MPSFNASRRGMSAGIFALGLVLWVVALGGLYFVWRTSRSASLPSDESPAARAGTPLREDELNSENGDGTKALRSAWDNSVADFEFVERSGRKVTNADLLGRPWIVSFMFTRCNYTCPILNGAMARLQTKLQDVDVRLVTITVDPRHDTTDVLARHARAFGADPEKWLWLTGEQDEIHRLINESFLLAASPNPDPVSGMEFAHSNSLLLIDHHGKVIDKYDGTDPAEMAKLVRDAKRLAEHSADVAAPAQDEDEPVEAPLPEGE